MKSRLAILVLLVVLVLCPTSYMNAQYIGRNAQDLALPDQNGDYYRLSDFAGHYIYLNFWASWCPSCDIKFPNLAVLQDKYQNAEFVDAYGFKIFGVSVDRSISEWQQILDKYQITWTECCDLKGYDSPATLAYSIDQVPTALLINPQGIIVAYNPTFQEMDAFLQSKQRIHDVLVYRINLGDYSHLNYPNFNHLSDLGIVTENQSFAGKTAFLGPFTNVQEANNMVQEVARRGYTGAHVLVERGHNASLEGATYAVYEAPSNYPPSYTTSSNRTYQQSRTTTPSYNYNDQSNTNYGTGEQSYTQPKVYHATTSVATKTTNNKNSSGWRKNKRQSNRSTVEAEQPSTVTGISYGVGEDTYTKPQNNTKTSIASTNASKNRKNKPKRKKVRRTNSNVAQQQPATTSNANQVGNNNPYSKQTTTTAGNKVKHNIKVNRYTDDNQSAQTSPPVNSNNGYHPYQSPSTNNTYAPSGNNSQQPNYANPYAAGNKTNQPSPSGPKSNYSTPPTGTIGNTNGGDSSNTYNPYGSTQPNQTYPTGGNSSVGAYNPYAGKVNNTPKNQQDYNPYGSGGSPSSYAQTPNYTPSASREEYKNPYSGGSSNSSSTKAGIPSTPSGGNYNPYAGQKNSNYNPMATHVPTGKVPDYDNNYDPNAFQNKPKSIYDIDEDLDMIGKKRKKRRWKRLRRKQQRYKNKLEQMNEKDQLIEERKLYDNIYGN